jgi:hypothetical protein
MLSGQRVKATEALLKHYRELRSIADPLLEETASSLPFGTTSAENSP